MRGGAFLFLLGFVLNGAAVLAKSAPAGLTHLDFFPDQVQLNLLDDPDFEFDQTPMSLELLALIEDVLAQEGLEVAKEATQAKDLAIGLVDLKTRRWASLSPNVEYYGASFTKIAILLGVFWNFFNEEQFSERRDVLLQKDWQEALYRMVHFSGNFVAGQLFALAGFNEISQAILHHGLYDPQERGGLWISRAYGLKAVRKWQKKFLAADPSREAWAQDLSQGFIDAHRSPVSNFNATKTVLSALKFFVLLEQGRLVNPWSSHLMKRLLARNFKTRFAQCEWVMEKEVCHDGILADDPEASWFGKSGKYGRWANDTEVIEGEGYRYVLSIQTRDLRLVDSSIYRRIAREVNRRMRLLSPPGDFGNKTNL